jgi:hypothetical protein
MPWGEETGNQPRGLKGPPEVFGGRSRLDLSRSSRRFAAAEGEGPWDALNFSIPPLLRYDPGVLLIEMLNPSGLAGSSREPHAQET